MLFHVLGHVDLDQRVGVAEHEFGQGLGEQRFADAGRAGEDEAADRPFGVFEPRPAAAHRLADPPDRLGLRDDPLLDVQLHVQQPGGLFGLQPGERNARHLADDLGDDLLVDRAVDFLGPLSPFASDRLLALLELVGLVAQRGGTFEVLVGDRFFLVLVQPFDLLVQVFQIRRAGHRLQPHPRPGLIDDVDRLVGKAAPGDVAIRQVDRGLERLVGDLNAVVGLVAVAQAAQDFERLVLARRLDQDRLKPPFERAVFLDVLAILIERGGADALHFASRQAGLSTLEASMAPSAPPAPTSVCSSSMKRIVFLARADLVHDGLDPLFELAAVLGAGDHHRQIQNDDPPVAQQLGHVAVDDHLRQAFDDRRLADPGFAEQHRIVLGAARQNLNHTLDFIVAADDRVELGLPRQVGQVAPERVQGRSLGLVAF